MAEELEGRISAAHRKGLEETMEGCSGSQDTAETGQNENVPEGDEANCNKELSTPLASECIPPSLPHSLSLATVENSGE